MGGRSKSSGRIGKRAVRARERRRRELRRRVTLWSSVFVGVALLGVVLVAANRGGGSSAVPVAVTAQDHVLGSASAPVTIVEYGDYKCPFCTRFFVQTQAQLVKRYVDTGKARLVFRDFVNIDDESPVAAEAAQCAGAQGKFWQYHDALYRFVWDHFYGKGTNVEGGAAYDGHYGEFADQVGLDTAKFQSCLDDHTFRDAVNRGRDAGRAQGVRGTPTFFVNGRKIVGAQPLQVFGSLIEAAAGS